MVCDARYEVLEQARDQARDRQDRPPRLALRPPEAASALGIGERLLWEKTHCGDIPCVRIGRTVVYPVEVLRRWLADQAGPGKLGKGGRL